MIQVYMYVVHVYVLSSVTAMDCIIATCTLVVHMYMYSVPVHVQCHVVRGLLSSACVATPDFLARVHSAAASLHASSPP